MTGPASSSFTINPAGNDHLGFSVAPSPTTAGNAINPAVRVQVYDAYGNLETADNSDQVTLTITGGPGGFAGGSTTTVTANGGAASFSNLVLDAAGNYTLAATATGGLTGPHSSSFTVSPAAIDHLAFNVAPGTTTAGVAISPGVQVVAFDKYDNLATNDNTDQVALSIASGPGGFTPGSTTTLTLSAGIASFSNLVIDTAGSYKLSENATGGITGTNSTSFTINPAAADHLGFTVQPGNSTAGLALTPTVQVYDKYNNLATNDNSDQVTLSIAGGPGGFASGSTTTLTVSSGVAAFNNLVLDTAGSYTLAESATGGLNGPNSSSFTINPAAANHLAFSVQPGTTTAGITIAPAVQVQALDPYGNLATNNSTLQVSLSVAGGPGGFTGGSTSTTTISAGVATFSNLVLDTAGSYKLAENATGGLTGPSSSSFTIVPAAPSQLAFSAQPGTTTAGAAISPAVQVQVLDQYGNLATNNNSLQVSLSVAGGPGGFAAGSTTTIAVSAGIATFSNLLLDTAGNYTLAENATGGVTGPNSTTFTITPAGPDHLAFIVHPSNTIAGAAISPAVQVQVYDKYGNVASNDSSDQVTLSVASGPGGFASGSTTTVTVTSGVAYFNNLAINMVGSYTLAESATGSLTGPNSASFTINPAAAASLNVNAPSTATAGTGFSVTITGVDQGGNGYSGTVTLSASDGQTYTPSTVNLVNGTATVMVTLDVADSLKLAATAGSVSGTSGSITVTSAAASSLSVSAPGTATAGTGFSVTVTGSDQYGNGYDGVVTLSASDGQTVTPSTVTLVNGAATVNVTLDKADVITLSATAGSLTGTSNITVRPAAANSLSFSVEPSNTIAGSAVNPAVAVEVLDQYGNFLTADNSDQVTLSILTLRTRWGLRRRQYPYITGQPWYRQLPQPDARCRR